MSVAGGYGGCRMGGGVVRFERPVAYLAITPPTSPSCRGRKSTALRTVPKASRLEPQPPVPVACWLDYLLRASLLASGPVQEIANVLYFKAAKGRRELMDQCH